MKENEFLDEHVLRIKKLLELSAEPVIVPVKLESYSIESNCFPNVEQKVKIDGGRVVYGWAVIRDTEIYEAEFHAVWESPQGELIEITPREGESETIFLRDDKIVYEGQFIDNVRVNITDNPVLDDLVIVLNNLYRVYSYRVMIGDFKESIPAQLLQPIRSIESLKDLLFQSVQRGGEWKTVALAENSYHIKIVITST